jgi:hypothetical protein
VRDARAMQAGLQVHAGAGARAVAHASKGPSTGKGSAGVFGCTGARAESRG